MAEIDPDNPHANTGSAPGFLAELRRVERRSGDKPRIGLSRRIRDEVVDLGQDPFLAFPDTDLSQWDKSKARPIIRARFMGFFGPHGALPLNTTEEVTRWHQNGDKAFVAFTDIFVTRFLQLYFRSWSDAHAISQFDHKDGDRFQSYLLAMAGTGTPAFRELGAVGDTVKLRMTPLANGRVKSPVRLRQMLELHLDVKVEVEEMVPLWMAIEPDALSIVGQQGSVLGQSISLGSRVCSVGEKIRLHIKVADKNKYRQFLPGGIQHRELSDIVFWYLGKVTDIDVVLWLPAAEIEPAVMGCSGDLGWTASIAPTEAQANEYVQGARYGLKVGLEKEAAHKAA